MQGEQVEAKIPFGKETVVTDVSWGNAMFDHFYCLVFHCSNTLCLSVLGFYFLCSNMTMKLSCVCSVMVTEKSFSMLVFCEIVYVQ